MSITTFLHTFFLLSIIDPYYFPYEAEKLGYHSQIILNGRIINDSMGAFVADTTVKMMVEAGLAPKKAKVAILGLTFKENCPDIRNSKVVDIFKRLKEYGVVPSISDPWANDEDAYREYGIHLQSIDKIKDADCVIVAVAHEAYKAKGLQYVMDLFGKDSEEKVLIDVKGIYAPKDLKAKKISWWRL